MAEYRTLRYIVSDSEDKNKSILEFLSQFHMLPI